MQMRRYVLIEISGDKKFVRGWIKYLLSNWSTLYKANEHTSMTVGAEALSDDMKATFDAARDKRTVIINKIIHPEENDPAAKEWWENLLKEGDNNATLD
jgi:hypothetical protein